MIADGSITISTAKNTTMKGGVRLFMMIMNFLLSLGIYFLLRIETFWYECETQFSID